MIEVPLPGSGVRALTTIRSGGVSEGAFAANNMAMHVGDNPEHVRQNRECLAQYAGVAPIQWLEQVHGTEVVHATAATIGTTPQADAAWSNARGVGCAVLTADCLPVIIVDLDGDGRARAVAVVHGGWRGLANGVLEATLESMPGPISKQYAWLGAGISGECYEVGSEVVDTLMAAGAEGARAPGVLVRSAREGHWLFDLHRYAEVRLRAVGVSRVTDSGWCSYRDERFYSYRQQPVTGRMATMAWLE